MHRVADLAVLAPWSPSEALNESYLQLVYAILSASPQEIQSKEEEEEDEDEN